MNIYVFGNKDVWFDKVAFEVAEELKEFFPNLRFVSIKPNEDLPFDNKKDVIILDAIEGLKEVKVFNENSIERLTIRGRSTVHDFDLAFQLKYLKKLGKIDKVKIIGLPMNKKEINVEDLVKVFKEIK